eukprot:1161392-Pelagomonas_calceolata.AAC.8
MRCREKRSAEGGSAGREGVQGEMQGEMRAGSAECRQTCAVECAQSERLLRGEPRNDLHAHSALLMVPKRRMQAASRSACACLSRVLDTIPILRFHVHAVKVDRAYKVQGVA